MELTERSFVSVGAFAGACSGSHSPRANDAGRGVEVPGRRRGVTLLLGVVRLLATWIPALRAARIDPVRALGSD